MNAVDNVFIENTLNSGRIHKQEENLLCVACFVLSHLP